MWSDGCAAQYKCKGNFANLSMYAGHGNKERNYFSSEHGQGEGDGEVGCVNKATEKARLERWRRHAWADGLSLIHRLTGISFA